MECNTELCLCLNPLGSDDQYSHRGEEEMKPLTIFYGGQICTCDVTEIQARAIIFKATQDMDMQCKNHKENQIENANQNQNQNQNKIKNEKSIISVRTNSGLSMKKSLQRFLLRRSTSIKMRNSGDNNLSN